MGWLRWLETEAQAVRGGAEVGYSGVVYLSCGGDTETRLRLAWLPKSQSTSRWTGRGCGGGGVEDSPARPRHHIQRRRRKPAVKSNWQRRRRGMIHPPWRSPSGGALNGEGNEDGVRGSRSPSPRPPRWMRDGSYRPVPAFCWIAGLWTVGTLGSCGDAL